MCYFENVLFTLERTVYKDLSRKLKRVKITDFLEKAKHPNQDAPHGSSENEDILPKRKRSRIIVLSSDEEENN